VIFHAANLRLFRGVSLLEAHRDEPALKVLQLAPRIC
jgi:hypothetical protein